MLTLCSYWVHGFFFFLFLLANINLGEVVKRKIGIVFLSPKSYLNCFPAIFTDFFIWFFLVIFIETEFNKLDHLEFIAHELYSMIYQCTWIHFNQKVSYKWNHGEEAGTIIVFQDDNFSRSSTFNIFIYKSILKILCAME